MPRLINGDALLEQMKHRKEYVGRPSDPVCLVEDAPTVATDINVPNNGWISVKDKPPKSGKRYLTVGPKGVMRVAKAYVPSQELPDWRGDPDYHWWECENKRCAVAYYMQLPLEPEKEAGHE